MVLAGPRGRPVLCAPLARGAPSLPRRARTVGGHQLQSCLYRRRARRVSTRWFYASSYCRRLCRAGLEVRCVRIRPKTEWRGRGFRGLGMERLSGEVAVAFPVPHEGLLVRRSIL